MATDAAVKIYISRTGTKAHLVADCSDMKNPFLVIVEPAVHSVLNWCKNCAKHLIKK